MEMFINSEILEFLEEHKYIAKKREKHAKITNNKMVVGISARGIKNNKIVNFIIVYQRINETSDYALPTKLLTEPFNGINTNDEQQRVNCYLPNELKQQLKNKILQNWKELNN